MVCRTASERCPSVQPEGEEAARQAAHVGPSTDQAAAKSLIGSGGGNGSSPGLSSR